jgi:hypothetical protein
MTRTASAQVRAPFIGIRSTFALLIAVPTMLIAFAPAQQTGQMSAKTSEATVSPISGASPAAPQRPRLLNSAEAGRVALTGSGALSFEPPVTYPLPSGYSISATVGDVNGDGIADIIVISSFGSPNGHGLVSVLLGNGDGTFQPWKTIDSGGDSPTAVQAGDVNNDGKLDIVVANCSSTGGVDCPSGGDGVLAVLLGNGDGTFHSPTTISTGVPGTSQMVLADVNLDGNLDAIVTTDGEPGGLLFLGNGDGTFQPPSALGCGGVWPIVADVNHDGKPDVLMACGGAAVYLGNGDGTFQTPVFYSGILGSGGSGLYSMAVADVKGDGELDVLAEGWVAEGDEPANKLGVLFGNGDGTFTPKPIVRDALGIRAIGHSLAVADLNGDGIPDFAIGQCGNSECNSGEGSVQVFTGTIDGSFNHASTLDAGVYDAQSIITADLNGDGKPDLVVAHYFSRGVTVLLNSTVFGDSPTSTSLTSSQNPSQFGQKVTFTATVSSASGPPPEGEYVTFFSGSAVLGKGHLEGGVASLTTQALPAGTRLIAASYRSDANLMASTSPVIKQVVTPRSATTTTLSSSQNPAAHGQAVRFTAVITSSAGAPPDGETVSFMQGTTVLGRGTLSGGSASFTASTLEVGTDSITAVYGGDSSFVGSGKTVKQVVSKAATSTALTSSANPSSVERSVTFTATVAGQFGGNATGTVTFMDGTTALATVGVSGGMAKYNTSRLADGTHNIIANYNGSKAFASSSTSLTQTVN